MSSRKRKPLFDFTNTINSPHPSCSSFSKLNKTNLLNLNPKSTKKTSTRAKADSSTGSTTALGENDNSVPSSPSRLVSASTTPSPSHGPTLEVLEPCSVYRRRQSTLKTKKKGKEIVAPICCTASAKAQYSWDKMNEGGVMGQSRSRTGPYKKKQRQAWPMDNPNELELPQNFIEQQRAYFAEVDAFELPEEEVTSADDLD
ncbi:hypothetical protein K2173_004955 [Erythroxylum novogranatense]|uniref:Sororin C-terminal region domain-containing protein n=1 Tax=Erythroxylum novogranatense TaxID=1862640 RepID=A0AAV8TB59_9ROSI|nr:hypothetical protein K2173_004955 [Erythroxylum novogranatense]